MPLQSALLAHFPVEVVEHTQLIAVQVRDPELTQVPRFVLHCLENLRPGIVPALEQFVDFLFAVEIQPDDHRAFRPVDGAERRVREEHSAIPLRDASNPAVIISPVETESEHLHVVLRGVVNVAHRNLGNGLWKVGQHWTSGVSYPASDAREMSAGASEESEPAVVFLSVIVGPQSTSLTMGSSATSPLTTTSYLYSRAAIVHPAAGVIFRCPGL